MSQTFSDYVTRKVPFLGGVVELQLRALDKGEAAAYRAEVRDLQARYSEGNTRREGEDDATFEARLAAEIQKVHAFTFDIFTRTMKTKGGEKGYYLRFAGPLVNEDDETRNITTAAQLHERGGTIFHQAVVAELGSLLEDEPLGNSSGSPSTSTVAAGQPTPSTDAVATTTVPLAISPASSTATVPMSPAESSSPAA